jgi:predicted O-methyltransferase YrrM
MSQIIKGIKNPKLAIQVLRSRIRKFNLNEREERFDCPGRLASLLGESTETLHQYHRELCVDADLQETLFDRFAELHREGELSGNTSSVDAETMYVLCRSLKPDVVIETGVRYGSYDAHILSALDKNNNGQLHSIDLPGRPSEEFEYGHLIPDKYRGRWNLHLGDSKSVLEDICNNNPPDIFLHDSLHTKDHMQWEYQTAYNHLSDGGILASHDVLLSDVFQSFAREHNMSWTRVLNTGIAVK